MSVGLAGSSTSHWSEALPIGLRHKGQAAVDPPRSTRLGGEVEKGEKEEEDGRSAHFSRPATSAHQPSLNAIPAEIMPAGQDRRCRAIIAY